MTFICTWEQNHVFCSIIGVTVWIFGSDAALPHDAAAGDQISPLLCLSVDQAHPQPPPPHKCRVVSVVDHLVILIPSTFRH